MPFELFKNSLLEISILNFNIIKSNEFRIILKTSMTTHFANFIIGSQYPKHSARHRPRNFLRNSMCIPDLLFSQIT